MTAINPYVEKTPADIMIQLGLSLRLLLNMLFPDNNNRE